MSETNDSLYKPSTETPRSSSDYILISNIPTSFHTSDLRCFFSSAVENYVLLCFHFRHRPEDKLINRSEAISQGLLGVNEEWIAQLRHFQNIRNIGHIDNDKNDTSDCKCPLRDGKPKNCCVIQVSSFQRFYKFYNQKNWRNKNGRCLPGKCIIKKVRVDLPVSGEACPDDEVWLEKSFLSSLPELRPPAMMPNGNVGTPTATFLQLIQSCQLPSHYISKLELRFPRYRGKRKYSCVGYDYDTGSEMSAKHVNEKDEGSDEDNDTCEEWERHEALHDDVTSQERTKERLYEEELEVVWEKGGSGLVFYTDAQFWEQQKGDFDEQTADDWDVDMSGYYEDGMGDMDHRDFLDMRKVEQLKNGTYQESVFKKPKPGPSQPYKSLRRKTSTKTDMKGRAYWEKHSSGVARKVMEKYGWKDGDGLGSSTIGPPDAIPAVGQHPRKKAGFGYHGEKRITWMNRGDERRKVRDPDDHIIGTVFDKPHNIDPPEPLLRSNPPTAVTHRSQTFVPQKNDQQQ